MNIVKCRYVDVRCTLLTVFLPGSGSVKILLPYFRALIKSFSLFSTFLTFCASLGVNFLVHKINHFSMNNSAICLFVKLSFQKQNVLKIVS